MIATPHNTRLLVTGTGGRLGRLLRAAWQRHPPAGHAPPVYQSRAPGADLCWAPQDPLPDALPACDTVVALWGCTSGSAAELAENSALAHHSRALAQACGARRVLHFSTQAVYGPGADLHEASPTVPAGAYGAAKLAMEQTVRSFGRDAIAHCCLRLANVVGADSLAPALAPGTEPVALDRFGDGHGPLRSYVAPGHLARILGALAILPPAALPDVVNLAAPRPVHMDALLNAAGRPISWRPAPAAAIQTVTLDTARLTRLLPDVDAPKSAQDMVTDLRQLETPR